MFEQETPSVRAARELVEAELGGHFALVQEITEPNGRGSEDLAAFIFCNLDSGTGPFDRLKMARVVPLAVQPLWEIESVFNGQLTADQARRIARQRPAA